MTIFEQLHLEKCDGILRTSDLFYSSSVDYFHSGKFPGCTSPEKNVPWNLDGRCLESQHYNGSCSFSLSPNRTCGFCGESNKYLRDLRDHLFIYKEKCEGLVIYGAALGDKYYEWMHDISFFSRRPKRSVDLYDTCFFQFVDGPEERKELLSADKSQILINVPLSKFPFKNNRRSVKLLKMNPSHLFPWAKRIIWQDAKLLRGMSKYDIPIDYNQHFVNTVGRTGTCSSFMSLPNHLSSISGSLITSEALNLFLANPNENLLNATSLLRHCATIFDAAVRRPSVSDSIFAVVFQCLKYYDFFGKQNQNNIFFQEPLIDSAFMIFDMRSDLCRKFNEDLLCSWLQEIHCHSDRDQVSFSAALSSTNLNLKSGSVNAVTATARVYANSNNLPMVALLPSNCHWYYPGFASCLERGK